MFPGDIVVGDGVGVIALPAAATDEIATEAAEMTVDEDFVLEAVRGGRSILGLYPLVDEAARLAFQRWREQAGR